LNQIKSLLRMGTEATSGGRNGSGGGAADASRGGISRSNSSGSNSNGIICNIKAE